MTSAASLVAQLVAAGTPPELLAAVAQELFIAEAERAALASRRQNERDRKADQRARSRDVTGQDVTTCDVTAEPLPPCSPLNGFPAPLPNNPPLSPIPDPIPSGMAPLAEIQIPSVGPEQVIEAWNVMAGEAGLPKARMTTERRKKLKTFIRRHSTDDITEAIWAIPRSPFLRGENDRGWKPGIDFLLQPSSFTKIIEGTYEQ